MDLTELLKNIQRFCKEELGLDVSLSELSKDGGIYAEIGPVTTKRYIRIPVGKNRVPVLFMCKSPVEPECIKNLQNICNALIRQKQKINGTTYQVCTVGEESGPHKTGRTEDMQVVYSCILHFEICERRENINEIK